MVGCQRERDEEAEGLEADERDESAPRHDRFFHHASDPTAMTIRPVMMRAKRMADCDKPVAKVASRACSILLAPSGVAAAMD